MVELKRVQPKSRRAWRVWLEKHHATSPGIWLVFAKKHTRLPSLSYDDAVEEALCFGWIDSLVKSIDDRFHMQIFTPRKAKSAWSALNKKRVEALLANGLMTAAGLKMIDLAKQSGKWDAWSHVDALTVPPELKAAIDANAAAKKNWPTYTASQRKGFLRMVTGAKRPETRAKRIARVVNIVSRRISFSELLQQSGFKKTKRSS